MLHDYTLFYFILEIIKCNVIIYIYLFYVITSEYMPYKFSFNIHMNYHCEQPLTLYKNNLPKTYFYKHMQVCLGHSMGVIFLLGRLNINARDRQKSNHSTAWTRYIKNNNNPSNIHSILLTR